jgi:hypothetical protein
MPTDKEPTQIQDRRESYGAILWHTKIPLTMTSDKEITIWDIRIYAALDFLAGERGWWYGEQEEIISYLIDKLSGLNATSTIKIPSIKTFRRSIKRLREKHYIVTQQMGLEMKSILKYFIVARKPELPPRHLRT